MWNWQFFFVSTRQIIDQIVCYKKELYFSKYCFVFFVILYFETKYDIGMNYMLEMKVCILSIYIKTLEAWQCLLKIIHLPFIKWLTREQRSLQVAFFL